MIIKESEAKNYYCPFRFPDGCVGSKCMVWRHEASLDRFLKDRVNDSGFGYCGLGGKPGQ